jgi:hypothetical protein
MVMRDNRYASPLLAHTRYTLTLLRTLSPRPYLGGVDPHYLMYVRSQFGPLKTLGNAAFTL